MKWHAKQRSLRVCQMLSLLPRQILRMSLLIWQVFNGSFGDVYLLLQVPVIIMIIHVENVNAFHRLKIIHWGSAVKCCVFGLWITIAGPRYDGHMVIQEVISSISKMFGAICSLQRSVTLQNKPSTFHHVATQCSQGSYHFTDFTGLIISQNALCQRGENYKTPNSFKCVWYH